MQTSLGTFQFLKYFKNQLITDYIHIFVIGWKAQKSDGYKLSIVEDSPYEDQDSLK